MQSTISLEGDKLIHKQKPIKDSDKYTEIIRYIKDGQLHIVRFFLHVLGLAGLVLSSFTQSKCIPSRVVIQTVITKLQLRIGGQGNVLW